MRKLLILSFCFGIAIGCSGCSSGNEELEADLNKTLEAIQTDKIDKQTLIYQTDIFDLSAQTNNSENEAGLKIANKIKEKAVIEIKNTESEDDHGTAEIKVTAPDSYKILEEIAGNITEYDTEKLFSKFEEALNEKYPTKDFTVQVELKLIDEHWILIPNDDLSNAFSGGLNEQYFALGKKKIDELLGKDDGHD